MVIEDKNFIKEVKKMFHGIGIWELLVILLIILLIFGAKRLPEMAQSLAKAIKEFQATLSSKKKEEKD